MRSDMLQVHSRTVVDGALACAESAKDALVRELLAFDLLLLNMRFGKEGPAPFHA
jgi:hypothetical protein